MVMPVMNIREVRVSVLDRLVRVEMRMWLLFIPVEIVPMLVVGIVDM